MRKFIYSILSFAAIMLVSCDYNDPNDGKFGNDPEAGWVSFQTEGSTMVSVAPNGEIVSSIPVVINAPVNKGLTVNYTIEEVDGSASYVSAGSVYIPKGELMANIKLPVSGAATCSSFNVVLTSTSRANVTVGLDGNGILSQEFIVSPFDINSMVGTYDALEDGQYEYVCNISLGDEPNSLIITNIYDVDPSIETKVFVEENGMFTFPSPSENYMFTDNTAGDIYFAGIDGLSTCANGGTIVMNFNLQAVSDEGTALYGPYNLVLTKQ